MIRILSAKQVRELDAHAIAHEPIASIDLMERASRAFVSWFIERFNVTQKVTIVCGTGNNGGDGLAVARLLKEWNFNIQVWIVRGNASVTNDFQTNYNRIQGKLPVNEFNASTDNQLFADADILIDAIFGSGLSRPVEGIYSDVINIMNETKTTRIAIDIPSGLMADAPSTGAIVHADHTVTFQLPKLAFLFPSSHKFVGEWHVVDIGLDKSFIKDFQTEHVVLTSKDIRKRLHTRTTFDHKGNHGHALLVAGSYGKVGAAVLSARALLRSGAGLLTVRVPSCGYVILQSSVPEAMVLADADDKMITSLPELASYAVIGMGPGLGRSAATVKAIASLLEQFRKPMVIDADGLNILSEQRHLLTLVPPGSILTPHPKEFERLVGPWTDDFQRLEKQKDLARKLKSVIVLKGAFTSIASAEGKIFFNSTGNPGMATGGTGDVLTGILTGLLSQGYESLNAALIGVYLHGLAGDLGAADLGYESLLASDIVDYLPHSFQRIRNSGKKIDG